MIRRLRVLGLWALALFAACGPVQPEPAPIAPRNACPAHPCEAYRRADSEPAPSCNGGACFVNRLLDYRLVVSTSATATVAPGTTFVLPLAQLFDRSVDDQCRRGQCVRLPSFASVLGAYEVLQNVQEREVRFYLGNDPSLVRVALPVRVAYRPLVSSDPLALASDAGLPAPSVFATEYVENSGSQGPFGSPSPAFRLVLAPGLYERTILPAPPYDVAYPPDVDVVTVVEGGGAFEHVVLAAVDKTERVTGGARTVPRFRLSRQGGGTLAGFTAFLRDTRSQRRISPVAVLTGAVDETVQLPTSHHRPDALDDAELVLAPPEDGSAIPSFTLRGQGNQPFEEAVYPPIAPPALVRGVVTTVPDGELVSGEIFLTSTRLYRTDVEAPVTNLTYSARLRTDKTRPGEYEVSLPRGEYDVVVVPDRSSLAKATSGKLQVDRQNDRQEGKTLEVRRPLRVRGRCAVADGRALAGATVTFAPASALRATPREKWPRPVTVPTDLDGGFSGEVDPGIYDVTVRPAEGTRLPWLVTTSRELTSDVVLAPFEVPAPVSASLKILAPRNNDPITLAVVRAFAPVAGAYVEIGRSITDSSGRFEMVLAGPPR